MMKYMMEIRQKTSLLHSAAEHSGYIKRLMDGEATVLGYAEYLFNLHVMYQAIEEGLESHKEHPVVKGYVTPELYKSKLIYQDLQYLFKDKLDSLELLSSTKVCVARIKEVTETNPELLVAYAYTRFLADLFGGRTFKSLLNLKYGIEAEGLNYYTFENLGDVRTYVMNYHNKLDGIQLAEDMKQLLINEICNTYIYNMAVSQELEAKLHPVA